MPPRNLSPTNAAATPTASLFRTGLKAEFALFRHPGVFLALIALVLVPSLYVLIYVGSVWDPYGNISHLPAGVVNDDTAVTQAGREIKLGDQIVDTLEKDKPFNFIRYGDAEAAKAAVRSGEIFFALLIPSDFTQRAVGPADAPRAALNLYVSEGGNYTAGIFAKRFGLELAHTLNEKISRGRWGFLVGETDKPNEPTLRRGLAALQAGGDELAAGVAKVHTGTVQLHDGLGRAADGSEKLADGSDKIAEGTNRLTAGMRQVEDAVHTMRSKLPNDTQLDELSHGSETLARGAGELKQGFTQLDEGVVKLQAGAGQLQDGSAKVPLVGSRLAAGAGQLKAGIVTFGDGLTRASAGATKLSEGMDKMDAAVHPLAGGLVQLNAGLRTLSERLPPEDQLTLLDQSMEKLRDGNRELASGMVELNKGSAQLKEGAQQLETGAHQLASGLYEATSRFEAGFGRSTATRLAAPVETVVETTAPVPNNGPAFAPYFSALSLWVGAVMMSFIFYLRRLPQPIESASRPTKWLVKILPLLPLGVLQATALVAMLAFGLKIKMANPELVWLVAALGSFAFVNLVVLFISVLGDAGRLLAVILLILQLSASAGIYPIQLSPPIYQWVHPYLPFSLLVRAFRATMFSAFDSRWTQPAVALISIAAGASVLGMAFARWKYVSKETYGPLVEL